MAYVSGVLLQAYQLLQQAELAATVPAVLCDGKGCYHSSKFVKHPLLLPHSMLVQKSQDMHHPRTFLESLRFRPCIYPARYYLEVFGVQLRGSGYRLLPAYMPVSISRENGSVWPLTSLLADILMHSYPPNNQAHLHHRKLCRRLSLELRCVGRTLDRLVLQLIEYDATFC